MTDRDLIFKRIKDALDPLPERTAYPDWEPGVTVAAEARSETATVDLFKTKLEEAGGVFLGSWEALDVFLKEQGIRKGYVDPGLSEAATQYLTAFTADTVFDREKVDDYGCGITHAGGAIAETGTVILHDACSPYRLGALAPWLHVAVVGRGQLHHTVHAAIKAFPEDPSIVFSTGPSKTADIEGIMIKGVHGPGVQACLLIE